MKERSPLRPGELVFAILLAAFSALALWQAYRISGFTGLSTPGIFPMLASATMLIASAFILADALSRRRIESGAQTPVLTLRLVVFVAMVAAYVFAMPWVGFMLSSAIFLFAGFTVLWRRSLLVSLALTAGTLAVIWIIFRLVFQVVLPRGTLLQGFL